MTKYRENITETLDLVYEHDSSAIEPAVMKTQIDSLGDESCYDVTDDPVFKMEGYDSDAPADLSIHDDKGSHKKIIYP